MLSHMISYMTLSNMSGEKKKAMDLNDALNIHEYLSNCGSNLRISCYSRFVV